MWESLEVGVKFQIQDKWLTCLFNISKLTWPLGSPSILQYLPGMGYGLFTPPSTLISPAQALDCPNPLTFFLI